MSRNMFGLVCGFNAVEYPSRALQNNAAVSPFRRWGQSSFRSRQGEEPPHRDYMQRRASSSDSDFYLKTMSDELHGQSSSAADGGESTVSQTPAVVNGPLSWGSSFEKLLEDVSGLHTFAEFLKKEFSAENIYFWTACERYRQLDDAQRPAEAEEIFNKHLAAGASEPVNVDSQARTTAQDHLQTASGDLFAQTQKQIFNLMKFDSYQRFIRSDLYKRCLDAEENNLPLPYPGDQPDAGLRTGPVNAAGGVAGSAAGKLKKSLSNAEDRRRKSLLPWHRNKRCKSKDRQDGGGGGGGGESNSSHVKSMLFSSTSSIPKVMAAAVAAQLAAPMTANSELGSSRSSLSSFERHHGQQSLDGGDTTCAENKSCLCRVLLTDGATTIVQTRPNESIRELIERLLDKRGIVYRAFEAFLAGSNKPLNVDDPSATIAGKEVTVDQRIVFKLDLPNRKVISVKSKTTKALEDVLRPILNKYNYRLDLVQVLTRDRVAPLNMAQSVQDTDGQRLQVVLKSSEQLDEEDGPQTPTATAQPVPCASIGHYINHHPPMQRHSPPAYLPPPVPYDLQQHPSAIVAAAADSCHHHHNHHQHHSHMQLHHLHLQQQQPPHNHHQRQPSYAQSHLDEITNKVFNELLQEKVVSQTQLTNNNNNHVVSAASAAAAAAVALERHAAAVDAQSTRSADWDTESGSSRIDRLRRNNAKKMEFLSRAVETTALPDADGAAPAGEAGKRPLMAKWKAGVKMQVTHKSESHDLLEGLKRAQRSRLEDQRGTEINFELPDFLKNKENINKNKLRKIKPDEPVPLARSKFDHDINMPTVTMTPASPTTTEAPTILAAAAPAAPTPQPAPRLSITKSSSSSGTAADQPIPTRRNSSAPLDTSSTSHAIDTSAECPSITFGSAYTADTSYNGSAHQLSQSSISNATLASTASGSHATLASSSRLDSSEDLRQCHQQHPPSNHSKCSVSTDIPEHARGPPPLPPKPKVLPIKPSNWAGSGSHNNSTASSASSSASATTAAAVLHSPGNSTNGSVASLSSSSLMSSPVKGVQKSPSTGSMSAAGTAVQSNIYLDQPSSSFV